MRIWVIINENTIEFYFNSKHEEKASSLIEFAEQLNQKQLIKGWSQKVRNSEEDSLDNSFDETFDFKFDCPIIFKMFIKGFLEWNFKLNKDDFLDVVNGRVILVLKWKEYKHFKDELNELKLLIVNMCSSSFKPWKELLI